MKPVWLPLQGPGGERPKAPTKGGWQSPSYEGIDPERFDGWVGLRCDHLIVIDCDGPEAAEWWEKHVGPAGIVGTWVRKTPRGFHYIYEWKGEQLKPDADIFRGNPSGIDIRVGPGSQIVFRAEGYRTIVRSELTDVYEP